MKNLDFLFLFHALFKFKDLREIELYFDDSLSFTNESFKYLGIFISTNPRIQSLSLKFIDKKYGWKKVTDTGLRDFMAGLQKLRFLQNLSCSLNSFGNTSTKSIIALSDFIQNMKSLHTINLEFSHFEGFGDYEFEIISSSFHPESLITNLRVEIAGTQVTEEGIINFFYHIFF